MLPIKLVINGSSKDLYQIVDEKSKILKYIGYSSLERLHFDLQDKCIDPSLGINLDQEKAEYDAFVNAEDITQKEKNRKLSWQLFFQSLAARMVAPHSPYIIPAPKMFGNVTSWALFSPTTIVRGDFLAWKEVLSRIDHPDLYQAWIWSIFADVNCRQALWLQGEGSDGKTVTSNAIAEYLGHLSHSINSATLKTQFGLQDIVGKRLILFPDTKNPNLIQSESVHQITGGDRITVAKRFVGQVEVDNNFRVLVTSNILPELSNQTNDQTRAIVIRVVKGPNYGVSSEIPFAERLKKEIPAFLYDCREKFQKSNYNIDKGRFDLPTEYETLSSPVSDVIERFISEFISEESDSFMSVMELNRDFQIYAKLYLQHIENINIRELSRSIKQKFQIESKVHSINGKSIRGYRELRLDCNVCRQAESRFTPSLN